MLRQEKKGLIEGLRAIQILESQSYCGAPVIHHFDIGDDHVTFHLHDDDSQLLSQIKLPLEDIEEVFINALRSLADSHSKQTLLRSISPDTIRVDKSYHVTFTEWGYTGEFGRDTFYSSPEEILKKGKVTVRSDIYALCKTFYSLYHKQLVKLPESMVTALKLGMSIEATMRPPSCENIIKGLRCD